MDLPSILTTLSDTLQEKNAKAIVVGGSVRDHFLNAKSKDYDVEVYGLENLEALEAILAPFGSVNLVGKSFGVLKFAYEGEEYDFSFPRTESKVAKGHGGFDVLVDGTLPYEVAFRRRDFTMNALGYDIANKCFIDPFGGLEDLKEKRLRHIDDATFVEDPLRLYRGVQFCARFSLQLDPSTKDLCRSMVTQGVLDELPKERVYGEWKKLLLKSSTPSVGFELMRELGILERYFPELHALIGVPQEPKWHPEGDVWVHSMLSLDAMARLLKPSDFSPKEKLGFLFAILCHDLGKATHTTIEANGRIRAIGHEEAGVAPTKSLMYRLTDEHDFIESLLPLVEHHLKPSMFYHSKAKSAAIRRLATKVNIEALVLVAKADFLGRTTPEAKEGTYHAGVWLLQKAKTLNVSTTPLNPLIQGRDLIALGMTPSVKFKEVLDKVYALQLEGKLESQKEALAYVKNHML